MLDQETSKSMCVSLRLDPTTLKNVEQDRNGKTLSATMNAMIRRVLSGLFYDAKEEVNDG